MVVKLNLNCCQRRVDPAQGFYNTPVDSGPRAATGTAGGCARSRSGRRRRVAIRSRLIFDPCHAEFPAIRFEDCDDDEGRFGVLPDLGTAISFADPAAPNLDKTYLPKCVTGRTYQINAAVLKGHNLAGVTLGKKPFRLALSPTPA